MSGPGANANGAEWTTTCDCCGKRRKCRRVGTLAWSPDYCLKECVDLSAEARKLKREEERKLRRENRPRLAYPIIGGPLDGQHADTRDFYTGGMYAHLSNEYREFNSAGYGSKRIGGSPTMIFVHKGLLKPLISARDR